MLLAIREMRILPIDTWSLRAGVTVFGPTFRRYSARYYSPKSPIESQSRIGVRTAFSAMVQTVMHLNFILNQFRMLRYRTSLASMALHFSLRNGTRQI